jgi:AcrR family transcriptional regulator
VSRVSSADTSGPTRLQKREQTRQRIVEAAWQLSRERGLTGWGLRDLGALVGMRAPSLYVYFANKNALYDELYAQGYRNLRAAYQALLADPHPSADDPLRAGAHLFFDFAVADPARLALLFLRVVPEFVPSPASCALAGEVLAELSRALNAAGVSDPAALDLWTASLTGLATQQVSNDPGGTRWASLLDRTIDILLTETRRWHDDPPR